MNEKRNRGQWKTFSSFWFLKKAMNVAIREVASRETCSNSMKGKFLQFLKFERLFAVYM